MSTSPSWFDKDKFSRLVKKVGPKGGATQPLPEGGTATPVADAPAPSVLSPPEKPKGPPAAAQSQRMMTSQSLSLGKLSPEKPPSIFEPAQEPIRAPAETAHISLVSPPAAASEGRALPTLPRRTSALPALKDIFQYEIPGAQSKAKTPAPSAFPPLKIVEAPEPDQPSEPTLEETNEVEEDSGNTDVVEASDLSNSAVINQSSEDLTAAWETITQLNQDVNRLTRERDQTNKENLLLRDQLDQADKEAADSEKGGASPEELIAAHKERDDALSEANGLREELRQARESSQDRDSLAAQLEEVSHIAQERDDMRREYVNLREEFENLKQEQLRGRGEQDNGRAELEQQLESARQTIAAHESELENLRQQMAEREQEHQSSRDTSADAEKELEALKAEVSALQQQLDQASQAKEEGTAAQRGLALSQKALQDTRDALREATESAANAKGSLENLRKENSTLVQQNMLLQAQHDQVSRDLSAAKAKLSAKS